MTSMVHRVSLALLMAAPLLASGRAPSDVVASAVCEQDDPQLTLMQLQAKPKQSQKHQKEAKEQRKKSEQKHQHEAEDKHEKSQKKLQQHEAKDEHEKSEQKHQHEAKDKHEKKPKKHDAHAPKQTLHKPKSDVSKNETDSKQIQHQRELHEQKVRQEALLKAYKKINMPTMEEVEGALETLVDNLEDMGEDINTTLVEALKAGEGSIKHVADFLEVAEVSAETAAGILGRTATDIVERLKKLSDEIQEELSKLATKSESLRGWLEETLTKTYKIIAGQANTTLAKMGIADADAEAAGNTSNSSLLQVQATVNGLRKVVQAGCLSEAETHALLEIHGRGSLSSHFREVDSNGDGCIRTDELERSLQSHAERPLLINGDAVALLAFRAVGGHRLTSGSSLEEAVARKGSSKDPCSVATSGLRSANSSFASLENKLTAINETMVDLMEKTLELVESAFEVVNTTVVAGLDAAMEAGLPNGMAEPIQDAMSDLMTGRDNVAFMIMNSEASIADTIAQVVSEFTPVLAGYIDGVSSKINLVCA